MQPPGQSMPRMQTPAPMMPRMQEPMARPYAPAFQSFGHGPQVRGEAARGLGHAEERHEQHRLVGQHLEQLALRACVSLVRPSRPRQQGNGAFFMFLPLGFGILSSFIGMLAIPAFRSAIVDERNLVKARNGHGLLPPDVWEKVLADL